VTAEADARRSDLDVVADPLEYRVAEYLAPERRQPLRVMAVENQFSEAARHECSP
jgi:hypothetical protein